MSHLNGRLIIVTGALGVLGRAVCVRLMDAGAQVIAVDREPSEKAFAGLAAYAQIDLSDTDATREAFSNLAKKHGSIDGLVNIAGGFAWETLAEGAVRTWDFMYALNLRTAVNACQAMLDLFPKSGGRIVNIGAAGSVKAGLGMGAYAASKAGVAKLTESLAEELKARNVTVNAILPSIIDTPRNRQDMPDADPKTWVKPESLAQVVHFLLGEGGEAITGALIPVTGRV